jgi:predicted nucleic acid-binding protein
MLACATFDDAARHEHRVGFLERRGADETPKLFEFIRNHLAVDGLAISYVTQFELRRGIEDLVRRGEGRRKLVAFEKFMERVQVLGLDAGGGEGWNLAAQFWAQGRAQKPAVVLADADLLIAATAALHGHEFATAEVGLADGLRKLAFPVPLRLVPME